MPVMVYKRRISFGRVEISVFFFVFFFFLMLLLLLFSTPHSPFNFNVEASHAASLMLVTYCRASSHLSVWRAG